MVDNFLPYSHKQLAFEEPVSIVFQSDEDNASKILGKTAFYDPENFQIVLYVDSRHPKDILRSLSHELVHHAQNCRGDLSGQQSTSPGYAQSDAHLRSMEREAYTKGNLIFRDFEDLIKTGKMNVEIDFSNLGEPKMSLKEWKNNEINTKLMKKWGLLKEEKNEPKDVKHADRVLSGEEAGEDAAEELQEDSEGEETYHYGEAEGHDEKELHDLVKRHATKSHIDALKRDMDYDEDHEDRHEHGDHFRENVKYRDDEEEEQLAWEEDPVARADLSSLPGLSHGDKGEIMFGDEGSPERKAALKAKRRAFAKQFKENKISVREAKQITRRIIERIKKEGK